MTLALAIVALVLAVVVGAFLVAGWVSTAQRASRWASRTRRPAWRGSG